MSKLINEYEEYLKKQLYKKNTISSYVDDIKDFEKFMNSKGNTLEDAENIDIFEYISNLKELYNYENSSLARRYASFRNFYTYLEDTKGICKVRVMKLKPPKVIKKIKNCINEETIESFINSVNTETYEGFRNKVVYKLIWELGLKVREIVDMQWCDVDLETKLIKVGYRNLKISENLCSDLNQLKEEIKNYTFISEYVFCKKNGEKITPRVLEHNTKIYVQDLGLDEQITLLSIRNSLIAKNIREGKPYNEIGYMYGITNLKVLDNYK